MKVLIAPDKFKGSLSSNEVCAAIEGGIKRFDLSIEAISLPLADGGEGSLDVVSTYLETDKKEVLVKSPLGESMTTTYLLSGEKAYIELASASGLQLLSEDQRNPLYTSTYGTGEQILDAISHGAKEIYLFLGGSATNDMGIGMAQALGYQFLDRDDEEVPPVGLSLAFIMDIKKQLKYNPDEVKFYALCDVENPLFGKKGAAKVYAAQKGANKYAIEILDKGLKRLAKRCKKYLEKDIAKIPGAGAAGGVGGGVLAFLEGEIISGSKYLFELANIETLVSSADLVITGEGSFDHQSLEGKLVKRLLDVCKKQNTPTALICGQNQIKENDEVMSSFDHVLEVNSLAKNVPDAMANASRYLEKLGYELMDQIVS